MAPHHATTTTLCPVSECVDGCSGPGNAVSAAPATQAVGDLPARISVRCNAPCLTEPRGTMIRNSGRPAGVSDGNPTTQDTGSHC